MEEKYTNVLMFVYTAIGSRVHIVTDENKDLFGTVLWMDSAYDNMDDDTGNAEACVTVLTDDGEHLGLFESQIKSIDYA